MALRKRVWRMFKENKGRYIGILLLLFFGSFAFVVMSGVSSNQARLLENFANDNLQEDIAFSVTTPLDISALEQASSTIIDSHRFYDAAMRTAQDEQVIRLLSPGSKVNIPYILTGDRLPQAGEIMVDPNFKAVHNIETGQSIYVGDRSFLVTGTAALPHYVYILRFGNDILPPPGFGFGLINESDFEYFPAAQTAYAARFIERDDIRGQTMAFNRLLREEGYNVFGWMTAANNRRIQMPLTQATGMSAASVPMAVSMFLITCLIVGVVIWRTVKADGVIIGTLYAQGYRRKELMRHYLSLPVCLAFIGGALGSLTGLASVGAAVGLLLEFYNIPFYGVTNSPVTVIAGILLPIVFLGFASWLVVRKELKKTAAELMKGDSTKTKINILERAFKLERLKFKTKFQLREQMRSISRLLFLFLGITVASTFMLLGFTLNNSMNTIFGQVDDMFDFAIEYSFNTVQTGTVPDGAEPFNALLAFPPDREAAQFYVMGILPDNRAVNLRDAGGSPLDGNRVNITAPLANRLRVGIGDSITFTDVMDGETYSITIDGIAETLIGQFIFMPLEDFNQMTGMAAGSFSGLLSFVEQDIDPSLLAGLMDMQQADDGLADIAASMTMMIVMITFVAGIIAVIIIYLVTSLMVEESKRTISMLKVFGYRGKEVAKLILNSSTWVIIAGFALGVPVMLAAGTAMWSYMGEMINMVMPMLLNPLHVLISFAILFAVYIFTKKLCGRQLKKISMSEALKAGE